MAFRRGSRQTTRITKRKVQQLMGVRIKAFFRTPLVHHHRRKFIEAAPSKERQRVPARLADVG